MLLEVGKLFWREFALSLAHFCGGGGSRVWKPFDSTAQRQYAHGGHTSRYVTPPQVRDRGVCLPCGHGQVISSNGNGTKKNLFLS